MGKGEGEGVCVHTFRVESLFALMGTIYLCVK